MKLSKKKNVIYDVLDFVKNSQLEPALTNTSGFTVRLQLARGSYEPGRTGMMGSMYDTSSTQNIFEEQFVNLANTSACNDTIFSAHAIDTTTLSLTFLVLTQPRSGANRSMHDS